MERECNPVNLYLDDASIFYSKTRKAQFNTPSAAREAHTYIKTNYITSKKRLQIRKENKQKYTKIQQFFSGDEKDEDAEKQGEEEDDKQQQNTTTKNLLLDEDSDFFHFDVCVHFESLSICRFVHLYIYIFMY